MATGKIFEIAFMINATMQGGFSATMGRSAQIMQALGDKTRLINGEQRQLERQWQQGQAQLRNYGSQLERLTREYQQGKMSAEQYKTSAAAITQQIRNTGMSVEAYRTNMQRLRAEMERTRMAQEHMRQAAANQQAAQARFGAARSGVMSGAMNVAIVAAPLAAAASEAMHFESAMADVKKVVDGTDEYFQSMQGDILALTRTMPMAATDIAKIVAAGGQAGIPTDDLMAFAEAAAKMGIAFDVTADQAGDMMAKWRTAFHMGQPEVIALADKINYLGNTTAASAPLISDVVTRIGPLGEIGGVASGEIAAMGASMIGTGVQSEIAATGIKNLVLGMTAGEGATKSQAAAFAALGMDATDMASRMQQDSKGAILDVLEALKSLDKEKQASVLSDLFGKESIGAIAPLLSNLDNLKENFEKVSDASQYAGSMQAEYEARCKTTENALQLAKNAAAEMAINLGSALLPVISKGAQGLAGYVTQWAAWANANQGTVQTILQVAAALGGLYMYIKITELASAAFAVAQTTAAAATVAWSSASTAGGAAVRGASMATRAAAVAQWAWNAAMTANPVGLVIVAIAAVIGALYLLYENFDRVKAFCVSIWESPAAAWLAFLAGPVGMIIYAGAAIIANWESIKTWFTLLWNDPKAALLALVQSVSGAFSSMATTVMSWGASVLNAITSLPGMVAYAIGFIIGFLWQLPGTCIAVGTQFIADAEAWASGAYDSVTTWMAALPGAVYGFLASLPDACMQIGAEFVAGAEAWASEAYDAVMNWINQIPGAISAALSGAWENIKAQFSGGFSVGVSTASNANGGIYQQGAFLTTFAEESPEAAIPLDGSPRAISLWQQAGEMLGMTGREENAFATGIANTTTPSAAPQISIVQNFYGKADTEEVRNAAAEGAAEGQKSFAENMREYTAAKERVSFA